MVSPPRTPRVLEKYNISPSVALTLLQTPFQNEKEVLGSLLSHFTTSIMISGIAHINLTVTPGTLAQAEEFYVKTLGLTSAPVPELQIGTICW